MAETLYQDYDLISRKAAIDGIEAYCDGCDSYNGVRCRACQIADAMDAVDEVEAAPVKYDIWTNVMRLLKCFPGSSFINQYGNFVAISSTLDAAFHLADCTSEDDIKCKVLEWLSYAASKGQPYRTNKLNQRFRQFMQDGINQYLGTAFSNEDFDEIYTYLGNGCNHQKTLRFVESGFDMALLPTREA